MGAVNAGKQIRWTWCLIFGLFWLTAPLINCQNQAVLNSVLNQTAFENAELGILVQNLSTNEILLEYGAEKEMAPASVLKIKTAVDALSQLGETHRFSSAIYIVGAIRDGILHGDIVLKGFGDPTLGSRIDGAISLDRIAADIVQALSANDISCIHGGVVADASYFSLPAIPSGYRQDDIANYYGAGAYGINIQDNSFPIVFERHGDYARIARFDSLAAKDITAEVKVAGYSDQAYAYFHPEAGKFHVKGKIPVGTGEFTIKGAMRNPPLYAAKKLDELLVGANIEVQESPGATWLPYSNNGEIIWQKTYESPPVSAILKPVLFKSNNLYAEVLKRHLDRKGATNWDNLLDGSGLSPGNRISCQRLMTSLQTAVRSNYLDTFLEVLPENGKEGNVKAVLKGKPGSLLIKSGSIGGVRTYMGLHQNRANEWIGFVCMANELRVGAGKSRMAWEKLLHWIADL